MAEESKKGPERKTPPSSEKDIQENKVMAFLSYLGILFLIPLLAKKDSPYCQYHAKQGLVLFIAGFIVGFVVWIPIIGWAAGIVLFVLWLMGVINVLSGKTQPIPLIGQFAEKMKL